MGGAGKRFMKRREESRSGKRKKERVEKTTAVKEGKMRRERRMRSMNIRKEYNKR